MKATIVMTLLALALFLAMGEVKHLSLEYGKVINPLSLKIN